MGIASSTKRDDDGCRDLRRVGTAWGHPTHYLAALGFLSQQRNPICRDDDARKVRRHVWLRSRRTNEGLSARSPLAAINAACRTPAHAWLA